MPSIRKFIATILAICTFLTGSVFAYSVENNLWAERRKSVVLQSSPTLPTPALLIQFLSIRRTLTPSKIKSRGTVLHIQDVHQNLEAQQNISGAIRAVVGKTGPCIVALEGATDVIDLSAFRRFSDQSTVRLVSDWMLRAGKISGPLHALIGFSNCRVVGIDDATHYTRNVEAYRHAQPHAAQLKTECEKNQQKWERTQQPRLNPELMAFNRSLQLFHRGELSYETYLKTLTAILESGALMRYPMANTFLIAARMESTLDFAAVERERAELQQRQSQDISRFPHLKEYANYLTASYSIESNQLFKETREMEEAAIKRLARTKRERSAMKESRQLYLAAKLLNFSMTRAEWKEYKTAYSPWTIDHRQNLFSFENFYREAEIRDEKMAENFLKTISGLPPSTNSILVTGGFHANGIDERLIKAGYTVVQATPKLSKADAAGVEYLTTFLQEKTPLDQLFEGEKLFLSPPQIRNLPMMELADASFARNPTDELKCASPSTRLVAIRQELIAHGKQVMWRQTKTGVVRILRLFFTSTRVENIQDGAPIAQPQRRVNSIFYNLLIFLGCQPTALWKIVGLLAVPFEGWLIFHGLNVFSFSVVSQLCFFVGGAGVDFMLSYYGHKWQGIPQPARPLQFLRTLVIMVMYGLAYSSVPTGAVIFLSVPFWNAVALHVFLDSAAFFWEQLIEIGLIHPGLRYDPELYEFFIGGFLYDRPSVLIIPSSIETTPDAYPHELVLGRLMTDFIPAVVNELEEDSVYILNQLEKIQILGVELPTQLLIAQLFPTRYRQGMIRISRNTPTFYVPLELFGKLRSRTEMRHMAFALIFGVLWRERYEAVHGFTKDITDQTLQAKIVHDVMLKFEYDWNEKEKPFLTWGFRLQHAQRYVSDKLMLLSIDTRLQWKFWRLKKKNATDEREIRAHMNTFRKTDSPVIDRTAVAKLFREVDRGTIIKIIKEYESLIDEAVAMGDYDMTLPVLRWINYLHVVDDAMLPLERVFLLCNVLLRNGRHDKELVDLLTNIRNRELEYPIFYSALLSFPYAAKITARLLREGIRPAWMRVRERLQRKIVRITEFDVSHFVTVTHNMQFRKNLILTFSRHAEIVNDDRNRRHIINVLNTCLRLLDEIETRYASDVKNMQAAENLGLGQLDDRLLPLPSAPASSTPHTVPDRRPTDLIDQRSRLGAIISREA